jgi:hypothetical protein
MRTLSEKLFEDYCAKAGIDLMRIPEGKSPTPDYVMSIQGTSIVVEVKEIVPNQEELQSERVLYERGYGNILSVTPGDRVRKKISDSSPQIKARTEGIHASILILFNQGLVANHLDPYCIRVAMYGLEKVHIAVPKDYSVSPYTTGMSYGPKRKMTEGHNTSISAIGVLAVPSPNRLLLTIYHNKYAAVPLTPRLLSCYDITQFELGDAPPGTTALWEEIVS